MTAGKGRKASSGRAMVVKALGVIRVAVAVARIASRVLDALNAIVFVVYMYICG